MSYIAFFTQYFGLATKKGKYIYILKFVVAARAFGTNFGIQIELTN